MSLFGKFFRGSAREAEERKGERTAYEARLLAPQWELIEVRLGRAVPAVLRTLYADRALITSGDLLIFDPARGLDPNLAWNVNEFIPADEDAISAEFVSVPTGAFAFASNEFGDPFYVQLGERPDGDGRVYVHYHDGDDTELVAPTLRDFLSWDRRPRIATPPHN